MIFGFGESTKTPFWMKNTPGPLLILWIKDDKVLGHTVMMPCEKDCELYDPPAAYDTAVELRPQDLKHLPRPGTKVSFK